MEADQIVDLTSLETLSGNDSGLMKMHINTFLQFAPDQVEMLKVKLKDEDWVEVRNVAHKLKPKLAYMGIKSLTPIIATIELYAEEEKRLDEIPELVSKVVSTCDLAFEELNHFVKSLA